MTRQAPTSLEDLLIAYAAGHLNTRESLMIATLMSVNPKVRSRVTVYESCGGDILDAEMPAALTESCLEKVLLQIEGCNLVAPEQHKPIQELESIPSPLRDMLYDCLVEDSPCWSDMPGCEKAQRMEIHLSVPCTGEQCLFLLRLDPGEAATQRLTGSRLTLILEGSYADSYGHYERGDISILRGGIRLIDMIAGPSGCLMLVLTG